MGSSANKLNMREMQVIKDNFSCVNSIILLSDGRLASCSNDNEIRIYSIIDIIHCDFSIRYNSFDLCEIEKGKLLSCSYRSMEIFNIFPAKYETNFTFKDAHESQINQVIIITNNRIASCSNDTTIKIWNNHYPYRLIKTLIGHTKEITSIMQLKEKEIIISGTEKYELYIWNSSSYQCITIIKQIKCFYKNTILQIDNHRVIIGSYQMILILNVDKGIIEGIKMIGTINSIYSLLMINDNYLLCGDSAGLILKYNIMENIFNKGQKVHQSEVTGLIKINEHQFISSSWDYIIKIWNIDNT